jgi:hypothetical protein
MKYLLSIMSFIAVSLLVWATFFLPSPWERDGNLYTGGRGNLECFVYVKDHEVDLFAFGPTDKNTYAYSDVIIGKDQKTGQPYFRNTSMTTRNTVKEGRTVDFTPLDLFREHCLRGIKDQFPDDVQQMFLGYGGIGKK